jgi:lipoprotein-anchoring transpeptidase ErfK/SrfK
VRFVLGATVIIAVLGTACGAARGGAHGGGAQSGGAQRSATATQASVVASRAATPAIPAQLRIAATSTAQSADACAHNTAAQRVIVDISAQHSWFCTRSHTVYQTAVTTGAVDLPYDSTPLGSYRIQARNRHTTLTLASGAAYQVAYWIPFDGPLFGFHDASWQGIPFGSAEYRTKGSHGCVHMPLAAMKYLYDWAPVGTPVTVRA